MVSVSSTKRLESSSTVHEILKGELLQHASEDDFIFHIKYINSKHNYCMFYDDEQNKNEFQRCLISEKFTDKSIIWDNYDFHVQNCTWCCLIFALSNEEGWPVT